jgi:hypothetical protein
MENKMLKVFTIIFWLLISIFLMLVVCNLLHFVIFNTKAFPFYYLSPIILLPIIGYVMMRIGEYIDNKKL